MFKEGDEKMKKGCISMLVLAIAILLSSLVSADCNNNVKDGDELGIDCGGSCAADCTEGFPGIEWEKKFDWTFGIAPSAIIETQDGSYALTGYEQSSSRLSACHLSRSSGNVSRPFADPVGSLQSS